MLKPITILILTYVSDSNPESEYDGNTDINTDAENVNNDETINSHKYS
jgi:hypothetical protein